MEALREFLKGWFGKLLLFIFLAPLAFLGIDSYFTARSNPDIVATVGEVNIPTRELNRRLSTERKRISEQLGTRAALLDETKLKNQVLDSLVDKSVLEQQAQKLGLYMSDAQVSAIIKQDATFHDANGQFSQSRFETLLKNNNMDKRALFHDIRTQSALSQLARSVGGTAIFPKGQMDKLIKLQSEQRNVSIHRIPVSQYTDKVTITDADIKTYYEKHKAELNTQKTVDLDYVVLAREKFAGQSVTADELKQAYLYKVEQRKARHILFTGENSQQKAESVLAEIKQGQDFAKLAKQHSQDTTSKDKGGLLDFESRGVYEPNFESALYGLNKGQVSKVINTKYGSHIIRLEATRIPDTPTFDDLKEEVTTELQTHKQENAYQDAINRINNDAADGKALEDIAKDQSLSLQNMKDYTDSAINTATLMGKMELIHPDVMKKAFDEFAITDSGTSVGIEVAPNKTLWMRSKNFRPVRSKTLAEATKEIRATLINDAALSLAAVDAKKVVSKVNASKDVAAVSKEMAITFESLGDISRQLPLLSRTEMTTAFSVPLTADGKVVAASDASEDGYSVLVVKKATSPTPAELSDMQKQELTQRFTSIQGQQQFLDYLEYAKSEYAISRNEKALEKMDETS